jgi:hypothetical protein
MKKNLIIIFSIIVASTTVCAATHEDVIQSIQNGVAKDSNTRLFAPSDKPIAYKLPTRNGSRPFAYTNFGSGDIYYALYSDLQIRSFNLATNQYLGGWELLPYNEHITMAGEEVAAAEYIAGFYGNKYTPYANPSDLVSNSAYAYMGFDDYKTGFGCLQQHPLRYSDLDKDGQAELILNLGYDWVVFSTTLNKVIFSARWHLDDELSAADEADREITRTGPNAVEYQYIASSGVDLNRYLAAKRSMGKLFFGDFDNDGVFDILMWRKLYQSRLVSDPIPGFAKYGEAWVHYELHNGEYKKQPTPEATIQDWLTSNNLTWQKGYPSQSECAGEEGQLIKEMHDPLLNDPDVLQ